MQTYSHSAGDNDLRAVVVCPGWLWRGPDRVSLEQVLRPWVCRGRTSDVGLLGVFHCSCRLAVSAMSQAFCAIQCLLAPKLFTLRSGMLTDPTGEQEYLPLAFLGS